jgi:hypothetical protein
MSSSETSYFNIRRRPGITLQVKVMYDGAAVYATPTAFFKPVRPV